MSKMKEYGERLKEMFKALNDSYPINYELFHNWLNHSYLIINLDELDEAKFLNVLSSDFDFGEDKIKKYRDEALSMIPDINKYMRIALDLASEHVSWHKDNSIFKIEDDILDDLDMLIGHLNDLKSVRKVLKEQWS